MTSEKSRETRLRRMAERQGLKLSRSRRRDTRALDFGRVSLLDRHGRAVLATRDLDQVEQFLTKPDGRS